MVKRFLLQGVVVLAFAGFISGCSTAEKNTVRSASPELLMMKQVPAAAGLMMKDAALPDHKIVTTGSVVIEVPNLSKAQSAAEQWVKKYNGFISDSSEDRQTLSVTAHVPAVQFESAMTDSALTGRILSRSVNSRDVTGEYYDLDTRLKTRKILLDRLQQYLKQAKTIDEIVQIETKINDVTSELEQMEGQFARLSKQIDLSEITLTAQLPVNQTEDGFVFPDSSTEVRKFLGTVIFFFHHFLFIILYVVLFGVPSVLFAFLVYWICCGKIGLLRRLFRKIRADSPADAVHKDRA
jgi:hypothetical protein